MCLIVYSFVRFLVHVLKNNCKRANQKTRKLVHLFRMPLFLQLHRDALANGRAILAELCSMVLPGLAQLILLVESDSRETLPCLGTLRICTENAEDCSLTTWHSCGSIPI